MDGNGRQETCGGDYAVYLIERSETTINILSNSMDKAMVH